MAEVGGISEKNWKQDIELEDALRATIRDPDKTLRLLVKLCKRVEALEAEVTYIRQLTGAI